MPQIFWLFYKLEAEAAECGGRVSVMLGNHEPMELAGDMRYAKPKYKLLAEKLGMSYRHLFFPNTELGKWLGTRNAMQVIGRNLFVHAGISRDFMNAIFRFLWSTIRSAVCFSRRASSVRLSRNLQVPLWQSWSYLV